MVCRFSCEIKDEHAMPESSNAFAREWLPASAFIRGNVISHGFPLDSTCLPLLSLPSVDGTPLASLSHHWRQNFSSSFLFASFISRSFRLSSIVANHSSRAASRSACVA